MNLGSQWSEQTAQQLVRHEALFDLLDAMHTLEDPQAIGRLVAQRWKYFANVAAYRLVVADGVGGHLVVDGFRGDARVASLRELPAWDAHHWRLNRPLRLRCGEPCDGPPLPEHLRTRGIVEVAVMPLHDGGRVFALLACAARHEPLAALDEKFIRLFGRHLADRLHGDALRRRAIDELTRMATVDRLTGLLNRGAVMDRLRAQIALADRTGQPLSVLIADVDLFKSVNDSCGHLAGDAALAEVARRMHERTRDGDSVGRFGGEEFLVVLYPCDAAEAMVSAERLRRAIAGTPFTLPGEPPSSRCVTVSVGCASRAPGSGEALDALLERADNALYRAKAAGRNQSLAAPPPPARHC